MGGPWIPRGDRTKPRSVRGNAVITRVSDLADPVKETWDDQLVVDLFCEEDAKDILAIPIHDGMKDHIAWHFDPKGRFSVKSAYRLGMRLRDV